MRFFKFNGSILHWFSLYLYIPLLLWQMGIGYMTIDNRKKSRKMFNIEDSLEVGSECHSLPMRKFFNLILSQGTLPAQIKPNLSVTYIILFKTQFPHICKPINTPLKYFGDLCLNHCNNPRMF